MSHVTVPGCECECANCVVYAHDTMGHLSRPKKRTSHDSCALHWPNPCTPHALQRLGRRNAANNSDFTPGAPPSHVGRRRKPTLVRDDRGVAHHGHGVRTRTWKEWHRLLERLRNGATATPCATVRCFHYKRGPWSILRIGRKSALCGPRPTMSRSCTTPCTRMVSDHARAAPGHVWRHPLSRTKYYE